MNRAQVKGCDRAERQEKPRTGATVQGVQTGKGSKRERVCFSSQLAPTPLLLPIGPLGLFSWASLRGSPLVATERGW